jgi:hypothetical protein
MIFVLDSICWEVICVFMIVVWVLELIELIQLSHNFVEITGSSRTPSGDFDDR